MKKSKLVASLALTGVLALGLASCKEGETASWHYEDYEFVDSTATATAATTGRAVSYVEKSYEERAEILGLLEEYAMKNTIQGLVLYDDGGYAKYSDRVQIPTAVKKNADDTDQTIAGTVQHTYITGYGFGIQSEGTLVGESKDTVEPTYLHTYETEDPATLNYMDDKGSVVGGYQPFVASSYFDAKMNATGDGYEWFPSTATEANVVDGKVRPIPLDTNGSPVANANYQTMANKYRIYLRTGSDFTYATLTTNANLTKYNGREVAIEDYVTPWKQLYTAANGLARGAENLEGASAIKGMAAYYNASGDGVNEDAWKKVGIKSGSDTTGAYLDFEFITPCTPFYAMYYLSSSLYAPIPQAFLDDIGGIKIWGSFNEDKTLTPVDTTLSSGVYVVQAWHTDQDFIFKNNTSLNPDVKGGANRYTLPGLYVKILTAAKTDPLAAWNEFQAGHIDSCGIPSQKVKEGEINTAGTQQTGGSSTTKLNLNTCTPEEWEYLFGTNGTITQTPESQYWDLKPAMSNEDFVLGLSWALNRTEYAQKRGVTPSLNYFSDNYLINPEDGVSYNTTEAHKKAMDAVYGEGWEYNFGFDYDKAVDYFKKAATKLLADGSYKAGDTIEIEICWQAESQIQTSGEDIAKYLQDAFNDPEVCNNQLTLKVNNIAVVEWSDVYYNKMMVGQFDIGFGGISGNSFNPINFMEVLKSDNSSGFTLNWGPDTNADPSIQYDGHNYTFDALFQAADTGCVVDGNGALAKTYDAALAKNVRDEETGGRTVEIKFAASNIPNVVQTSVAAVVVCWYSGEEYDEVKVDFEVVGDTLVLHLSQELVESYQGSVGFDIYFETLVSGSEEPTESLVSLYSDFPVWE